MKSCFVLVIGLLLTAFSCENKDEDSNLPEEQIIGQWDWQYSIYFQTQSGSPYILNPDTLGFSTHYVFEETGKFKVMRDENIDSEGVYWFEKIEDQIGEIKPLRLYTQQGNYIESVSFSVSSDTLVIDETEVDGPKRIFIKVK